MSQLASSTYTITLHQLIMQGEQILKAYNKPDATIDAKLLMCYLLNCKSTNLLLNRDETPSSQLEETYLYLVAKRAQGIPLQYITKDQEFMGLKFYVDERVLIPRQDTETLVEAIIDISKQEPIREVMEIGCGSGCISISLAHYIQDVKITAIDISQEALEVTLKNAIQHKVNDRISLVKSNLFQDYRGVLGSMDLIVSNPPYISKNDYQNLMQEVKGYEPKVALTDDLDGLTFYTQISKEAKLFLKPTGIIAYEVGYNQSEAVSNILADEGFGDIQIIKDLAQKDRVIIARNIER